MTVINIYCDESCHQEHDHHKVMVLGAVWCYKSEVRRINDEIKRIKGRYCKWKNLEVKWTKISFKKASLYIDLVDYFFDEDALHFRALIIPDKAKLNHRAFGQTHDEWYYKMYFDLIKVILDPRASYHIYLDIKDTKGASKIRKLREVLSNDIYDFDKKIIERIQLVRSHEIGILQLTDLLIGAVSYANRGLITNKGKLAVVEKVRTRSGRDLLRTTLLREGKVNLFRWRPADVGF